MPQLKHSTQYGPSRERIVVRETDGNVPGPLTNPTHQLQQRIVSSFNHAPVTADAPTGRGLAVYMERGIETFSRAIGVLLFVAAIGGVVTVLA